MSARPRPHILARRKTNDSCQIFELMMRPGSQDAKHIEQKQAHPSEASNKRSQSEHTLLLDDDIDTVMV